MKTLTIYSDSKQCNLEWKHLQFIVIHPIIKNQSLLVIVNLVTLKIYD